MYSDIFDSLFQCGYSSKIEVWIKDLTSQHPAVRGVAMESLQEFLEFCEKNSDMLKECSSINDMKIRVLEEISNVSN